MFRRILISMMLCGVMHAPLEAGVFEDWASAIWGKENPKPPKMKILVSHDLPGVVLEVKGKYQIYDPHAKSYLSTRFIGKRKFIQPTLDGLKWGEEFPGIHQIEIIPENNKTTVLVDGIEYKGNIYIYDIGGSISVINEVDMEDYLESVLSPQFDDPIPAEALAAVAIAARTQAYYMAKNPKNIFWDVDANQVGYEGYGITNHRSPIQDALKTTKYMILGKKEEGNISPAPFVPVWGSDTGGKNTKATVLFSRISLFEAEEMAKNGQNAAQILGKAFPEAVITVTNK